MSGYQVSIDKSTVSAGAADTERITVLTTPKEGGKNVGFDIASNPAPLKEIAATDNFMKPDQIVIGTDYPCTAEQLQAIATPTHPSSRLICRH